MQKSGKADLPRAVGSGPLIISLAFSFSRGDLKPGTNMKHSVSKSTRIQDPNDPTIQRVAMAAIFEATELFVSQVLIGRIMVCFLP
jgi:nitric oxide reductase large subunit